MASDRRNLREYHGYHGRIEPRLGDQLVVNAGDAIARLEKGARALDSGSLPSSLNIICNSFEALARELKEESRTDIPYDKRRNLPEILTPHVIDLKRAFGQLQSDVPSSDTHYSTSLLGLHEIAGALEQYVLAKTQLMGFPVTQSKIYTDGIVHGELWDNRRLNALLAMEHLSDAFTFVGTAMAVKNVDVEAQKLDIKHKHKQYSPNPALASLYELAIGKVDLALHHLGIKEEEAAKLLVREGTVQSPA